jgi:hypothetical protein
VAWLPEARNTPFLRLIKWRCSGIGGVGVCPPKAKVTSSNRVGCANSFLFHSAICAPGLKLPLRLIRASKQMWRKIVAECR